MLRRIGIGLAIVIAAAVFGAWWYRARVLAPVAPVSTPAISSSTLGIQWQEVPGNPALTGGACFSWRCAGMTDPTFMQTSSGISLWFETIGIQRGDKGYASQGPYVGMATGIFAPSTRFNVAVEAPVVPVGASGTWDRYVETPTIREMNGSLTMWYLGYAAPGFVKSGIGEMQAENASGTIWRRPAEPIYRPAPGSWDSNLITGPTVLRGPDGIWRLYYTGVGVQNGTPKDGVGLLTSKDGLHWTAYAHNPVFEIDAGAWDSEILEQAVVYAHGQYWMWYSGWQGELTPSTPISIGLATSSDGIHWNRYAGNPVITPGAAGSWDDLRVLAPDVAVEPDGSFLMVAYGQSKQDAQENKSAGSIGFWRSY